MTKPYKDKLTQNSGNHKLLGLSWYTRNAGYTWLSQDGRTRFTVGRSGAVIQTRVTQYPIPGTSSDIQ